MPLGTARCLCGCGVQVTTGSEFAQGHAIRYARYLHQRANLPTTTGMRAAQEIADRGWGNFGVPAGSRRIPQNFGFEAEFFGISHLTAVRTLQRVGLEAQDDGYHHDTRDYWRVTTDGSVAQEGLELVSPVLRRDSVPHRQAIRTGTQALRDEGAVVNSTCGLHVHHSTVGLNVPDIAQCVAHYALFQELINTLLPPSRRNAGYARPMSGARAYKTSIENHTSMEQLKRNTGYNFQRHVAVNLTAMVVHDTVEFRQHSGTLNASKIRNWVALTRLFMDIGTTGKTIDRLIADYGSIDSVNRDIGVRGMIEYLGGTESMVQFYEARQTALRGNEDDEDVGARGENYGEPEEEYVEDESEGCWYCWQWTMDDFCGWGSWNVRNPSCFFADVLHQTTRYRDAQ